MSLVAELESKTTTRIDVRLAAAHSRLADDLSWLPAWRISEMVAARTVAPIRYLRNVIFLAAAESRTPAAPRMTTWFAAKSASRVNGCGRRTMQTDIARRQTGREVAAAGR